MKHTILCMLFCLTTIQFSFSQLGFPLYNKKWGQSLNGKPKKIIQNIYYASDKFGELVEDSLMYTQTIEFDHLGRELEYASYSYKLGEIRLLSSRKSEYHSQFKYETWYNEKGKENTYVYRDTLKLFEIDNNGDTTKVFIYNNSNILLEVISRSHNQLNYIKKHKYNSRGQEVETTTYNEKGEMIDKDITLYDLGGRLIGYKQIWNSEQLNPPNGYYERYIATYKYHPNGNLAEKIVIDDNLNKNKTIDLYPSEGEIYGNTHKKYRGSDGVLYYDVSTKKILNSKNQVTKIIRTYNHSPASETNKTIEDIEYDGYGKRNKVTTYFDNELYSIDYTKTTYDRLGNPILIKEYQVNNNGITREKYNFISKVEYVY